MTSKAQQKRYDFFRIEIENWLVSIGARPGTFRKFQLDTKLGILHITPEDAGWVACAWDDIPRALQVIGKDSMNNYSGKWNFHYPSDYFKNMANVNLAINFFKQALTQYLME